MKKPARSQLSSSKSWSKHTVCKIWGTSFEKKCADIPHNLRFHTEISSSPKQIDAMFQQFKNTLCSKKQYKHEVKKEQYKHQIKKEQYKHQVQYTMYSYTNACHVSGAILSWIMYWLSFVNYVKVTS